MGKKGRGKEKEEGKGEKVKLKDLIIRGKKGKRRGFGERGRGKEKNKGKGRREGRRKGEKGKRRRKVIEEEGRGLEGKEEEKGLRRKLT